MHSRVSQQTRRHTRREQKLAWRRAGILNRLEQANRRKYQLAMELDEPVMNQHNLRYELAERRVFDVWRFSP